MLHVILLILKILGIILLIILGLLLLVLWAVLFVAASYQVQIEKQDTLRVSARAGWLFQIVTVRFLLDGGDGWNQKMELRLFGIPIWNPNAKMKPKKRKKKRRRRSKKEKPSVSARQMPPSVNKSQDTIEQIPPDDGKRETPKPDDDKRETPKPDGDKREMPKPDDGKRETPKESGSGPSVLQKIRSFFQKVIYAIKSICDKIKHMKERIQKIGASVRGVLERKDAFLEFWNLEAHRRAREAILKEVRYLWKKFRPKKIEGKVTFGFDDPALTGLCMGGVGMFCAWYPERLQILPDFEKKILEGDVRIRGKVRFYVLVRILWNVYFNQDIRHMYKNWKQL